MKLFFASLFTIFLGSHAFAIPTCESTVVPLALEMAKASGQSDLNQKLYIDVAADYSAILVTLRNSSGQEGAFRMTMGDDFARRGQCIVMKVEAL